MLCCCVACTPLGVLHTFSIADVLILTAQSARFFAALTIDLIAFRWKATWGGRSLRKLQFPLDRLEARLVAQGIEERVDPQLGQSRIDLGTLVCRSFAG